MGAPTFSARGSKAAIGSKLHLYEGRGGRMKGLLQYDFKCFVYSSFFLLGLVIWGHYWHLDTFQPASALYWTRVVYAFSAFPFMFFNIPGLQSILTHTKRTGFNRHGAVVPYLLPPCDLNDKGGRVKMAKDVPTTR